METGQSPYVTVSEAARMLGVSPQLIYKLIRRGELKATCIASTYRILRKSVRKYIRLHTVVPDLAYQLEDRRPPTRAKPGAGRKGPSHPRYRQNLHGPDAGGETDATDKEDNPE